MLASSGDATDDWGLQSFVVVDDDFGELIQSPEMDGVGLNVILSTPAPNTMGVSVWCDEDAKDIAVIEYWEGDDHSQAITEFCKFVGAPIKMKGNLIRKAKTNGDILGFLV